MKIGLLIDPTTSIDKMCQDRKIRLQEHLLILPQSGVFSFSSQQFFKGAVESGHDMKHTHITLFQKTNFSVCFIELESDIASKRSVCWGFSYLPSSSQLNNILVKFQHTTRWMECGVLWVHSKMLQWRSLPLCETVSAAQNWEFVYWIKESPCISFLFLLTKQFRILLVVKIAFI